jgi:hypothetical protein
MAEHGAGATTIDPAHELKAENAFLAGDQITVFGWIDVCFGHGIRYSPKGRLFFSPFFDTNGKGFRRRMVAACQHGSCQGGLNPIKQGAVVKTCRKHESGVALPARAFL